MHCALELAVPVMDSVNVTSLLVRDAVILGAYGFDMRDGTRHTIHSDSVILATGGRGSNTLSSKVFRCSSRSGSRGQEDLTIIS